MNFPKIDNCKFFLVGGSVRDKLLGIKPKDLDYIIITELPFQELVDKINENGKVYQAKEEFLTIRCRINGDDVDIAYPRTDGTYSDFRRPDNVIAITTGTTEEILKEDASRRDFTINALYMDEYDNIFDFYSGQGDLKWKRIKTIGSPLKRFNEDYLRILRAIRFSVNLGFSIENITYATMKIKALQLKEIATERIMIEINKSLSCSPLKTYKYLSDLAIFDILKDKGINFEVNNKKRN